MYMCRLSVSLPSSFTADISSCADIIFVVEESPAMQPVHTLLTELATTLDKKLCNISGSDRSDCGNRFAMVGYGGRQNKPRILKWQDTVTVQSRSLKELVTQLKTDESLLPRDSYWAINWAMHNVPLRWWPERKITSLRTMILFAATPREEALGQVFFREELAADLHANHFSFHAAINTTLTVLDVLPLLGVSRNLSGYLPDPDKPFAVVPIIGRVSASPRSAMVLDYVELAFGLGGSVWDTKQMVNQRRTKSLIASLVSVIAEEHAQVGVTMSVWVCVCVCACVRVCVCVCVCVKERRKIELTV